MFFKFFGALVALAIVLIATDAYALGGRRSGGGSMGGSNAAGGPSCSAPGQPLQAAAPSNVIQSAPVVPFKKTAPSTDASLNGTRLRPNTDRPLDLRAVAAWTGQPDAKNMVARIQLTPTYSAASASAVAAK